MVEDTKLAEKRRLAEALRANLRRRKAARGHSPRPAIETDPKPSGDKEG